MVQADFRMSLTNGTLGVERVFASGAGPRWCIRSLHIRSHGRGQVVPEVAKLAFAPRRDAATCSQTFSSYCSSSKRQTAMRYVAAMVQMASCPWAFCSRRRGTARFPLDRLAMRPVERAQGLRLSSQQHNLSEDCTGTAALIDVYC